ncbi:hypothetical protein QVD17_12743 [Tagetes erecta]|uniref:Cytochrome c domain-containing protein n=1 Tax=Tagetes erecta TaxID=13708 RepID=A0AAD8KV56_TARER|nr:hypothetical protein QVD17_12743 [Tagetes erecta]
MLAHCFWLADINLSVVSIAYAVYFVHAFMVSSSIILVMSNSGPNLNGLFGRQSGTEAGYSYSAANKIIDVIWGEDTLYDYLLNPKKYIPAKMGFPGLKKPQDRADLIAYLKQSTA